MSTYYKLGQNKDDYPEINFYYNSLDPVVNGSLVNLQVDVQRNHKKLIREIGAASAVLLKNENEALPLSLDKLRAIGIFGSAALVNVDGPNACVDRGCAKGTVAIGWGRCAQVFTFDLHMLTCTLALLH